jgi:hypothetical protein
MRVGIAVSLTDANSAAPVCEDRVATYVQHLPEVVRLFDMLVGPLLSEGGASPARKSSSLTDAMLLLATTFEVASST